MSLILEGFMGCGKSRVGALLAGRLSLPFMDTDALIEKRQSESIAGIFESVGEEAFRQMETSILYGLWLSDAEAVISLGGGTPVRAANKGVIKRLGRVIYLRASADVLIRRLENGMDERPMLKGHDLHERVRALLNEREDAYVAVADEVINLAEESPEEVCDRIMESYEDTCYKRT